MNMPGKMQGSIEGGLVMIQDEVLFTPQLATVVVDLHRRISDAIADACEVSFWSSVCSRRFAPMMVR